LTAPPRAIPVHICVSITGAGVEEEAYRSRGERSAMNLLLRMLREAARASSDFIAMLYEGRIIAYGTRDEIRANKNPFLVQFIKGTSEGPIQIH